MQNNKVWQKIKPIFLFVTFPIWYPWKLLFIKKEGNKFKDVDSQTKIFRIIRAPITKSLKLVCYIFIILFYNLIRIFNYS